MILLSVHTDFSRGFKKYNNLTMEQEGFIIKIAGSRKVVEIRCPKCKSSEIIAIQDKDGYYDVSECTKCGYKK